MKLITLNPVTFNKLIDYHYNAYKGDKRDFLLGVKIIINKEVRADRAIFPLKRLEDLENKLDNPKEADVTPINNATNNNIRLTWNGQSNALIDMFRQLKTMVNNKNEYLLADSYDDIATFLMNGFTNFEQTKRGTILTQLKTNDLVKKTEKRVTIECKAPDSPES